jgi:hypothetical protein
MSNKSTIANLFEPEPVQWGLRGDPYLWREMAQHFFDVPLPSSAAHLTAELEAAFQLLTNHPLSLSGSIHMPRHSHGGMSSGLISIEFWQSTAFPLLLSRFMASIDLLHESEMET